MIIFLTFAIMVVSLSVLGPASGEYADKQDTPDGVFVMKKIITRVK